MEATMQTRLGCCIPYLYLVQYSVIASWILNYLIALGSTPLHAVHTYMLVVFLILLGSG
ncbi:hypothetical protein EV426DRAFT_602247 [Tirmania nivea]|nr:hypothetical protein EV426DRAFT_602247 [Tirmania nivea]